MTSFHIKRVRTAIVFLALGAAPAAAQGAPSKGAEHEITQAELAPLAQKVKVVRAEPSSLTLRVGEQVSLGKIKVTAFDGSGRSLGYLLGYDFSIKPGEAATAVPRVITGARAGSTELIVRYPREAWKGRTGPRPEARVKVIVKP